MTHQCLRSLLRFCFKRCFNSGRHSWSSLLETPLKAEAKERPKTLVCHDMQGGYIGDHWEDGCQMENYYFRHWANIDTFVYFSHHLLTIPPPGWVTAASLHGVQVLGTLITEW